MTEPERFAVGDRVRVEAFEAVVVWDDSDTTVVVRPTGASSPATVNIGRCARPFVTVTKLPPPIEPGSRWVDALGVTYLYDGGSHPWYQQGGVGYWTPTFPITRLALTDDVRGQA